MGVFFKNIVAGVRNSGWAVSVATSNRLMVHVLTDLLQAKETF